MELLAGLGEIDDAVYAIVLGSILAAVCNAVAIAGANSY